jgi:metal-responsive CopG/Arc/MetJ family transcriptional regulator
VKTAISIDKKLFTDAEGFARTTGLSRSKLYCTAISEYIQNHTPDIITERLNNYYKNNKNHVDKDLRMAASRLFAGEDW